MAEAIEILIKARDETGPAIASVKSGIGGVETTWKDSFDRIGSSMRMWGAGLTLGLTTPLVAGGIAAFNLGSDVEESMSKVNTIFGTSSSEISAWATGAAEDFGMSKGKALDLAGGFGNMFTQMGMNTGEAAGLSQKMVELASDFGSFHNVQGGGVEVSEAMQAAFRGEYDSLQKYVPLINAASVEQEALKTTGKDSAKELTGLEKATAAAKLIMEGAGVATGDFDRTSQGAANKTRILTAKFEDAATTIGQKLLPIGMQLLDWVEGAIDWFTDLNPTIQNVILGGLGLAAALGPVLIVIGSLASAISLAMPIIAGIGAVFATVVGIIGAPVIGIIAIIAAVGAAIALLWTAWSENWGGIQDKVKGVVKYIGDSISGLWKNITGWFKDGFDAVGKWLTDLVTKITDWFKPATWIEMGKDLVGGIIEGIKKAASGIFDGLKSAVMGAVDGVKNLLGIHSPSVVAAREIGLPFAQGIGAGIRSGMPVAMRNVTNNNNFNIELVGGASAGQDVYNTVQLMSALYG